MENENLKLWESVEETPKDLIKTIKQEDGTILNSIPAINRIKKATEKFGVYGLNWGLKDIKHSEQKLFQNLVLGNLEAIFFYTLNNIKIEFEISNSISIVSSHDGKMKVNFSYRKAIETDTVTKALSKLGFNADIYTDGDLIDSETKKNDLGVDDLVVVGEEIKEIKE